MNAEFVNCLDDVIRICERLDQYIMIPNVSTDHELGVFLVHSGVMAFDESVRPYLDYSRVGIEYYSNHGGAYIAGGYVARRDSVDQSLIDAVENDIQQELGGMKME